jgi:hypothetical protein
MFGLGAIGFPVALVALWYAVLAGPPPCPADSGCSPTPWVPVALGLAMVVPITILLHPGVAAFLGTGVALAWWQAQRTAMPPWWSLSWAIAIAAFTLIAAAAILLRRPRLNPSDDSWPASAPALWHAMPPEPSERRWVARRLTACVAALLMGAGGMAAWAVYAQDRADERRASAPVVGGTVTDSDGGRVTASLDDQTIAVVTVLDDSAYPVGSRQQFYRPDSRSVALVRTPEDHTWWLFWSALVGGLALMLAVRVASHHRAVRRLFSREQPVRAVRFLEDGAGVHVLLDSDWRGPRPRADVYLLRFPVTATMPYRPGGEGVRPMWPVDYPTAEELATAQEAHLYGEPTHWRWCALAAGSRVLVPNGPAELMIWHQPQHWDDEGPSDDADDDDDAEADDTGLVPAPAAPGHTSSRVAETHRASHALFYLYAAGAGLVAGTALGIIFFSELARLDLGLALLALWAAVGAGIAMIWRSRMVSRVAWNDGGVTVAVSDGVHRLAWRDVVGIDPEPGKVVLHTEGRSYDVYTRDSVDRWPVTGERTTDGLAAALSERQRRAEAMAGAGSPEPPSLVYPIRPMPLWALWTVETAMLFAALQLLPLA